MTITSHLGSSYTQANFISEFFIAGRSDEIAWNDHILKIQITCSVHGKMRDMFAPAQKDCMRETWAEIGSRVWSQNSVKWERGDQWDGWVSTVSF